MNNKSSSGVENIKKQKTLPKGHQKVGVDHDDRKMYYRMEVAKR